MTQLRNLIAAAAALYVAGSSSMMLHAQQPSSAPPQPAATSGGSTTPAPRRLTGDEIDAMNRKGSDTARLLNLRPLHAGESQALGHLTQIECAAGGAVRVYVKTDVETLVASAPKLQSIDLRTYRGDKEFTLGCGSRPASDRVYLTWRSAAAPASSAGRQAAPPVARGAGGSPKNVGAAVALEFLPSDFVPPETAK